MDCNSLYLFGKKLSSDDGGVGDVGGGDGGGVVIVVVVLMLLLMKLTLAVRALTATSLLAPAACLQRV